MPPTVGQNFCRKYGVVVCVSTMEGRDGGGIGGGEPCYNNI